jgi:hypothetical protein
MSSPIFEKALHDLRAAALRAVARREGLPAESWRVEDALSQKDFGVSVDRIRQSQPWYVTGYRAVRYRLINAFR